MIERACVANKSRMRDWARLLRPVPVNSGYRNRHGGAQADRNGLWCLFAHCRAKHDVLSVCPHCDADTRRVARRPFRLRAHAGRGVCCLWRRISRLRRLVHDRSIDPWSRLARRWRGAYPRQRPWLCRQAATGSQAAHVNDDDRRNKHRADPGTLAWGGIVEVVGWPWLFLVNIPFCLVGFLIAWHGHDATVEFSSRSPDFKELSLFALLIGLAAWLLYAINTDASIQLIAVSALSMSATAIGFGRYEWRHRFPLIPVAALARRTPAFIATGAFVFGYAAGVFFAAAPLVLLNDNEKTLSIIGIITSAAPAGLFIGAFIRRHMSARFSDLPGFFAASAALYGIGGGMFQVSNIKSASKITPDRPSMAGSLLRLFQNLGIALGATVALYSLRHGIELPTSVISGTGMLWGSTAVVLVALLSLSAFQNAGHYDS